MATSNGERKIKKNKKLARERRILSQSVGKKSYDDESEFLFRLSLSTHFNK
jgi:hypothetical protein